LLVCEKLNDLKIEYDGVGVEYVEIWIILEPSMPVSHAPISH
jgi:hypothetical protein